MIIELITIGDEIISGHTVDTNSAMIARKLLDIGFWVTYKSAVGDEPKRMEEVIYQALKRADIVIATGGLGPTDDDITKRVIVKVFKRNLVFHEEVLEDIKKRYQARGIKMPSINQNQALLPQGAMFLPNRLGSAVGIVIAEGNRIFAALPGVPREAEVMMAEQLIPYLEANLRKEHLRVIKLRTTGIIESALAEKIKSLPRLPENVHLAYLPWYGGVDLRIMSFGQTKEMATGPAENFAKQLRQIAGKYIYGEDEATLEGVIGNLLRERHQKLATAESCTAGLLAAKITDIPGSSDYFERGVVAYSNQSKMELLGVPSALLEQFGAVSQEVAEAMASGVREKALVDYGVAITGIAGPGGGTAEKPVGTVFIATSSEAGIRSRKLQLGPDREMNRKRSVFAALELLRRTILGIE
ncbi:MAG: competence/damage-inducible protein A [bacterium]|jgi:nicotinamide-nucleotide amidase